MGHLHNPKPGLDPVHEGEIHLKNVVLADLKNVIRLTSLSGNSGIPFSVQTFVPLIKQSTRSSIDLS